MKKGGMTAIAQYVDFIRICTGWSVPVFFKSTGTYFRLSNVAILCLET